MTIFRIGCLCFLILLFANAPLLSRAEDSPILQTPVVGTLVEVEGSVIQEGLAKHGDKSPSAAIDSPVHLYDTISTGAGGKAHILFVDDTELTLGENAEIKIDEYVFDADDVSGNKARYSILRGAFLLVSGLMTKKENPDVNIETSYGSIGLRGTTVWGGDLDSKYGVFVQDGEVVVTTDRGRIRVPKGEGVDIADRFSPPTRPKAWSPEKIERAKKVVALKRRETIQKIVKERKAKQEQLREERRAKIKAIMEKRQENRENLQDKKQERLEDLKEKRTEMREQHQEKLQERAKMLEQKQEQKAGSAFSDPPRTNTPVRKKQP